MIRLSFFSWAAQSRFRCVLMCFVAIAWLTPSVLIAETNVFNSGDSASAIDAADSIFHISTDRGIISLALGFTVLIIVGINWRVLRSLPGAGWWVAAILARMTAWSAGLAQGLTSSTPLHYLEHGSLVLSTGLAAMAVLSAFSSSASSQASPT